MIYKREFKRNFKALLIWSGVLSGLILLTLAFFPEFAKQQQEVTKLLESLPESMIKGFGLDQLSIADLIGYYGVRVYMMTTLLGSIYTALLASSILAKEESEKTIEFLLSKPVTRTRIVTEKLLLVLTNVLILNAISAAASLAGFQFTKDQEVPMDTFALLVIAGILLHMTFGSVGFMLSSILRKTRGILSISLGMVLATYFMSVMSGIAEELEPLKYFSPFKYVDAASIINENGIEPLYTFIMAAIILLSTITAYIVYNRKDIAV